MWRMRHVFASVAAVVAVLALSACGGDSSPEQQINVPTETQASLDKAQFIAQADSICAEANASIEQFAAAGQGVTEADQIAQLRQGVVDQINELGPPSEDRTTLDQFLNAMTAQVSAGEKIGLASERGEDTSQFETELDTAKSEAETAASTYGFKECGSPISSSSTSSSTAGGTADTGGTVTPTAPSTPAPSDTPDSGGTSGGTGGATGGGDTGSGAPDSSGGTGAPSGGVGPG
jgi:predicted small lipoprotein YifL